MHISCIGDIRVLERYFSVAFDCLSKHFLDLNSIACFDILWDNNCILFCFPSNLLNSF